MASAHAMDYPSGIQMRRITDHRGKGFDVAMFPMESGRFVCLVIRRGRPVGHVVVTEYFSAWHIDDITIGDPKAGCRRGLVRLLSVARAARYRRRGIGAKVVGMLVSEAKVRGVRQIQNEAVGHLRKMMAENERVTGSLKPLLESSRQRPLQTK